MKKIFEETEIAEYCFLFEALKWTGFTQYPKKMYGEKAIDVRLDDSWQENYEAELPSYESKFISSDEAERVGLPKNPDWEELISDEDIFTHPNDSDFLRKMLKYEHSDKEKSELEKKLKSAEEHQKKQAAWEKLYDSYIELYKSKLFVALREGKIFAMGRVIPEDESDDNWSYWTDNKHEPISKEVWSLSNIDWDNSTLKDKSHHYCHILVKVDDLLQCFPEPEPDEIKQVSVIAGQHVIDEAAPANAKIRAKRGRKSLAWQEFYVEVAARLKAANIPDKQEAFVAEMQEWCMKAWGKEVGRSTILEKVSPFFKLASGNDA